MKKKKDLVRVVTEKILKASGGEKSIYKELGIKIVPY